MDPSMYYGGFDLNANAPQYYSGTVEQQHSSEVPIAPQYYSDNVEQPHFPNATFPVVENIESKTTNRVPLSFLFGPLPTRYCYIFYFISFVMFVLLVLVLIGIVVMIVRPLKGVNYLSISTLIFTAILYFVAYLENRLWFNMCEK